ncbi:hypothetical protein BaRGS_00005801 [Batillaria attramentaria]|uniref:Major facilitator superfamily (MFS) profile domain-containing protein n=1 Tax=Batillaria attramentaria TaxID=370345 RepID=A0ABD0LU79_9CAEN
MTKIGAKFLLISGLFLAGVCIILFGILDKSPPGVTFAVLSFTVRSFEAVGASAYYTSSFTILANELPDHVTTVFGYLEMFYGAGAMAGPVIGGFLYELGGYGLPFWVVGSLLLSCTAIMAVLLPNPTAIARKQEGSMLRLLSSPRVVISVISVAFGGYVFGFINATLALHLEKFHLRVFYVGLLFVMLGGLYAIMTLFYGWISDRNGVETARVVMAAGNIVLGVAFLLSGPAPFLSFLGSQVLVGLVLGAVLISPITFAYSGARVFLGPVVGSTVVQYAGFQWSSTVTAFLAFFVASCIGLNALQEKMCPKSDDTGKNAEMIICDDVKSANHHIPRDNLSSQ